MTGGSGFLGSHLLKHLLKLGHEVTLLKRTTSNLSRLGDTARTLQTFDSDVVAPDAVVTRTRPDCVIHCATDYGRKQVDPLKVVEANLILPLKLLKAAPEAGVKLFINTDTLLDKRVSHYSLSKRQFTEWMQTYSQDLHCINVALEHFYGPGDDRSKFVSAIIQDLLKGVPQIDLTRGEQKRDFIFIDDVIQAFATIIDHHKALPARSSGIARYEVGSGNTIQIKEFVQLAKELCRNTSTELRFGALPYRANEVMQSNVQLAELNKLGWKSKVDLKDGLTRTIEAER